MKKLYFLIFNIFLISCQEKEKLSTEFSSEVLNCNNQLINEPLELFVSNKHGFTIKFPKGWKKTEDDNKTNNSFSVMFHPIITDEIQPIPMVQAIKWHDSKTSTEYFNLDRQKIKKKYKGKILEFGEFETNQNKYNWMIFVTPSLNKQKTTQLSFYTKKGDMEHYLITFLCTYKKQMFDEICKKLPLIESFKLK